MNDIYSLPAARWKELLTVLDKMQDTPINPSKMTFPPDCLSTVNAIALKRLGLEMYQSLKQVWKETSAALSCAKKGDLNISGKMFNDAASKFYQFPEEARNLAEVLYKSRIAYYYYKSGRFEEAEESIAKVLQLDDQLQTVYPAFHGHKLHVLQNKGKTLAFRKKYVDSAELVLGIMRYMIDPTCTPYPVGQWGREWLEKQQEIQPLFITFEFTLFDFCRDAQYFPAFETEVVNRSRPLVKSLNELSESNPVYQVTSDWFEAKQALYIDNDMDQYIERSIMFIARHSERYNLFKLLLLLDFLRVLKLLGAVRKSSRISKFIKSYYQIDIR